MIKRENIIGYGINFILVALAFYIMFLGGLRFLIVSIIFYGSAGLFEFVIMNRFYGPKVKLLKKIPSTSKIANGFLWVHGIIRFIRINDITIYDFKKLKYFPSFTAYLIMLSYILIAFFLFKEFSYWAFIIYLVPLITNIAVFFSYHYFIYASETKTKKK